MRKKNSKLGCEFRKKKLIVFLVRGQLVKYIINIRKKVKNCVLFLGNLFYQRIKRI